MEMAKRSLATPEELYPFKAGAWWVDDVGAFHLADALDESFDALFLRHLGQVGLVVTPAGINIRWDTAFTAPEALAGVINRLLECRTEIPVSLDFCYQGWVRDMGLSPSQAINRILKVQEARNIKVLYPTRIEEHSLSEIATSSSRIRRGFQHWERSGGQFDKLSNDILADLLPKVSIYQSDESEENVVFSWIGQNTLALQVYGHEWAQAALGQPFNETQGTEQKNYVDRTSAAYIDVWETGEPRYQFVCTQLFCDGIEVEWLHYARLLTRVALHGGRPGLVCLSDLVRHGPLPLPGIP